jgi:signal transduction histidine kinase
MNLRSQLLILFGTLAVVPLVAIGVVDYVRYLDALEQLIGSQTFVIAEQAADELADRFTTISANLTLLSTNSTIVKVVEQPATGSALSPGEIEYLAHLEKLAEGHFGWVQVRRRDGALAPLFPYGNRASQGPSRDLWLLSAPVATRGDTIGAIEVGVRIDSLLSRTLLDARFGRRGTTALVDVRTGDIIRAGAGHQVSHSAMALSFAPGDTSNTRRIRTTEADATIAGVLVRAPGSPLAVLSLANVSEFSAAFGSNRNRSLLTVFTLSVIVATFVLFLLWRATRSLSLLTAAADEVGRGNLNPRLPPPNKDEVGRLASAFETMTRRLRETLGEIERSRKMAAVGAFSSQIAHEIRTPLTSIKLNLQTLERASRQGQVGDDLAEPIEISLREARRLDQVVRGVLQLGRGKVDRSSSLRLADLVVGAVKSMQPTLTQHAVTVSMTDRSDGYQVLADRSLLMSAVQNLLLNASEAMPGGGRIGIEVADAETGGRTVSRLTIMDEGSGVPVGLRDQVFEPFFTTKPNGSGLGLALAHRTIEEHGGRLWIDDRRDGAPGAAFVLELPVNTPVP